MKTLLLCTSFNSLTQAVYTALVDRGDEVIVLYAIGDDDMMRRIESFEPDIILSPFLKQYLPPAIYEEYPTYVLHPGPLGDRGANTMEYALLEESREWGVVILKADEHYDGGDIYAQQSFAVRETYKASLYRQEVILSTYKALEKFFTNLSRAHSIPQIMNPLHKPFTQAMRTIDWSVDSTQIIIKKIYLSDSFPGVLDEVLGIKCYLFGVHREGKLLGKPKEILAKRDGAICLGTIDGAVWITHLKAIGGFKLPATYLLKERLVGIKEDRLPLIFDKSYETFYEVSVEMRDRVAYLCFNFHNGAMSTQQCIRLKYAVEYLREQCDVLVLVGGMDFFSNGIHLNILEDSLKKGEDGWANINAMNDLVSSLLYADDIVTIASFARNAAAGGLFLGLACDFVIAKEGIVLNPHYKTLGLSGSEYHSYTLPKRVGEIESQRLLESSLPLSVQRAKGLGMVDEVYSHDDYYTSLHNFAKESYDDEFIWEKQEYLERNRADIEAHKERELAVMYPEFWESESEFHKLRKAFVYKICPREQDRRFEPELRQ